VRDAAGPGYVHFTKDLPPEFYHQLTAEARVPQRTSRGIEYRWVNTKRARNEVLDCTVYAIFCTHALGLHTYTDKMWERLEQAVQPANQDLFASPPAAAPAVAMPAAPVRLNRAQRSVSTARPPTPTPRSFASDDWSDRL
jgi:phage terminase large subunit GpA-like protein